MLKAVKEAGQITHAHATRNQHGSFGVVPHQNNTKVKLSETGITRKESMRAQQLASIPQDEFGPSLLAATLAASDISCLCRLLSILWG
jgi:hypothetical protein